jgi:RNA polymerase sigma-70 factor (ECF subfamily)
MDRERFEALYAEHAQALYGFLAYRTGDRTLAEDLLGDTFERVLKARRRYDPRRASERTWIYSIALNALRDNARRSAAERQALDRDRAIRAGAETADPLDLVDERDALHRALAMLTEEERDAIRRQPHSARGGARTRGEAHDRGGSCLPRPQEAAL